MVSTCKSLRVQVCICGVGKYESMFRRKNMSVLCKIIYWYVCLSVWLVQKPMFSCMNRSVFGLMVHVCIC